MREVDDNLDLLRRSNVGSDLVMKSHLHYAWHWGGIYPVVRDKNTLLLTDGTHTVTMSSTSSGYSIAQHTDTSISSPSNGQLLKYNGTNWVNATISTGTTTLSGCTDVDIATSINNKQALTYNASY